MADQRFPRSVGTVQTPMTAVALVISVPRTDPKFCKVKDFGSNGTSPAPKPTATHSVAFIAPLSAWQCCGCHEALTARKWQGEVPPDGRTDGARLPVVIPSLPCDPRRSHRASA
jgi:hypothetical protein